VELLKAIDDAVAFVTAINCREDEHRGEMSRAEVYEFCQLAEQVFLLASEAELLGALPQRIELHLDVHLFRKRPPWFESKLHLPGDWDQDYFMLSEPPRWYTDMAALRKLAERRSSGKHPKAKRKTGRPRNDEGSKESLVQAALVKHHGYESDGSIENYSPVKVDELAKLAGGEAGVVSRATVSRFMTKHFGKNRAGAGYKQYVATCQRRGLGEILSRLEGEEPARFVPLREDD
jgi:hypothetical protein